MTGHINRSFIWIKGGAGDDSVIRSSVQNKPEMPDFDGREDMVDAMVPDHYDKEITRIRVSFAGTPDTATALPVVRVAPQFIDSNPTDPSTASETVTVGRAIDKTNWVRFVPDVAGEPGADQFEIALDDPILWPEGDLVHVAANWNDAGHLGYTVHTTLDWQRA